MPAPLTLACHPSSHCPAVQSVSVAVQRRQATIELKYSLVGALSDLRIPSVLSSRINDSLWRHTCFEAFVALRDVPAYHEMNFSPSGEWAVFSFERYRDGSLVRDEGCAPRIAFIETRKGLELSAVVSLDPLGPLYTRSPLRIALSAVIESTDGKLSYWALDHPPGEPDFHHPSAFVLNLE